MAHRALIFVAVSHARAAILLGLLSIPALPASRVAADVAADLRAAAKRCETSAVRRLIGKVEDIDAAEADGRTALMLAVESGCDDVLTLLLAKGADPDLQDARGRSALMLASRFGRSGAVRALLAKKARADLQSRTGLTALTIGCYYGYADVVRMLIEAGADVDQPTSRGRTPLYFAADREHVAVAELLAEQADLTLAGNRDAVELARERGLTTLTSLFERLAGRDPAPEATPTLTVIPDAWPARPRTVGYEFNQKNHHAAPEFERRIAESRSTAIRGLKPFRVIGVSVTNPRDAVLRASLRSKEVRGGERILLDVPPRASIVRYFPIPEPPGKSVRVELHDRRDRDQLAVDEVTLGEEERSTWQPIQAIAVARELEAEAEWSRTLEPWPGRIRVLDDHENPIEDARVVLFAETGIMVYEGRTDKRGIWSGELIAGPYRVLALGEIEARTEPAARTEVRLPPTLVLLEGRLSPETPELRLAPAREASVVVASAEGDPLPLARAWVTPASLASAYRYERIAAEVGERARLESRFAGATGPFRVLMSESNSAHVTALARLAGGAALLSGTLGRTDTRLELSVSPASLCWLRLVPGDAPGGGSSATLRLIRCGSGLRERLALKTGSSRDVLLAEGSYRVDLSWTTESGASARFLPYSLRAEAGRTHALFAPGPLRPRIAFEAKEEKVQFWLALADARGRVLAGLPEGKAMVSGLLEPSRELTRTEWELPLADRRTNVEKLDVLVSVPFAGSEIRERVRIEPMQRYGATGANSEAPALLAANVEALLPEVKRALDGSLAFLGLSSDSGRLTMDFDILMPPGVGGTGGGNTITLPVAALAEFATGTDLLPRAFRHELGHCLSFGHDPYMLLAPVGVDEARFGRDGYRLLHAKHFRQTVEYLTTLRHEDRDSWSPGEGVFPSLRLLYGDQVHKKLLEERRRSESFLKDRGLSSIERIAALYSIALGRNLAWMFRAHGWPVFDGRVELGFAAAVARRSGSNADLERTGGTPLARWWVYGSDSSEEEAAWRLVEWPDRFIFLDENRTASPREQRYHLFRTLVCEENRYAQILCASDVQLEIRLNGEAVGFVDASPQYAQPLHDEHMLEQKRRFAIALAKGENFLEVAARQLPGSKGFLLEFATPEGRPLRFAVTPDGPPGGRVRDGASRLARRAPIDNPSFEEGSKVPTAWIVGPNEGEIRIAATAGDTRSGTRRLQVDIAKPGRGGLIQRVVVRPGTKYRLTAALRTSRLDGRAYVGLFRNDIHSPVARTPDLKAPNSEWRDVDATWHSGEKRVIYVVCYVEGAAGSVAFDDVRLSEVK